MFAAGTAAALIGTRNVFLASGAWGQKSLRMENDRHLRSGLDFLADIQLGRLREACGIDW